jgi:GTPase Era involved in 16S rRNA processing
MDPTLSANLGILQEILGRLPEGYSMGEAKRIASLLQDIDFTPLRLSIIGPFDSGKSSIVNAIIGRPILPTSIKEMTATSFRISMVGPSVQESLELPNGARLPLSEIAGVNISDHQMVGVHVHSERIPVGFEILDTPGLSSAFEIHQKITADALNLADVLLLVIDAKQGMSQAMLQFLGGNSTYAAKTFVLLNKADLIPESDRAKILEYNTQICRHLRPAGVMLVSATSSPGVDLLEQLLIRDLPPRAEAMKSEVGRKRLSALASNMLVVLREMRESISLDTSGIDARILELSRKREGVVRQVDRRTQDLTASVKSECRQAVVSFEKQAMSLVDTWAQRIAGGEPAMGFSTELRSAWEEQAGTLAGRIQKLVGEYRTDLQGIAVDAAIEVPWWTDWVDWAFAALAIIGPMTGGWGNILEATVGKLFGQEIKKRLVKGMVQKALQAAVIQWVSQVTRQVDGRLADLSADARRHAAEDLEPQLREAEDALEVVRDHKARCELDVEVARKAADEDIAAVERVATVLNR